jgi:hypothetical protein
VAYELYKKTSFRTEEPTIALTPDGRLSLNAATCRILSSSGVARVVMLWDAIGKKVALKAAAKFDKNAFAVSLVRDEHAGSIRAKSFLNYIGWRAGQRVVIPATWDETERMLEIALPAEYLNSGQGTAERRKPRA